MRKRSLLTLTVLGVAFASLVFAVNTQAFTQFKSGDSATVGSSETVDSSLWVGARNVDIAGTVDGDLFCGAMTLNISGTVKGDVICGAQTVNISGTVEGDLRVGAQTVNISGSVGGTALVGAQTVTTDSKSRIGSDATLAATDISLNGQVGRDLNLASASTYISGQVGRDIRGAVENLKITSGAKVGGSIEYTSKNTAQVAEGAQVGGSVTQTVPKQRDTSNASFFVFSGAMALALALMLLVTALLLTLIFPRMVHRVSNKAMDHPWWSLGAGFLAGILVPVVGVLLAITFVGLPLAILMFIAWALIALSSGLFTAYYVGRRLFSSVNNALLRVLFGGLVLLVVFMIPVIGFIAMLLSFWIGSGMILLTLKDMAGKPKYSLE